MQGSISKNGKTVSHIYKPKLITRDGEEVERVLYIGSSGTQFIDTGIIFNRSQPTVEMKFKDLTVKGNLFGTYNGYNAWSNGWGLFNNKTVDGCYYVHYKSNQKFSARTEYATVKMDRNKVYIDGSLIITQGTIDNYACNNSLYMLSGNFGETRKAEIPTLKIEYFKVWKDDVLVRDFIPVKYGTEYCMLDLVENKLYHNKGTGSFSGGDRVEVKKISQVIIDNGIKYYLLDYLENTAQSHINLGIACNEIKNIEFVFQGTAWSSDQIMFGVFTQEIKGCNYPQIQPARLNIYGNGTSKLLLSRAPSLSKKCKITIPISSTGTAYYYEDGIQVGSVNIPTANRETGNMILFTLNLNGSASASHYSKIKVYSFKGWGLDDKPLFDLVPVEKENGTKGMLDLVNHTFYENSGTGTFSGNKKEIILVE